MGGPRIDFYIAPDSGDSLTIACRLAEKAWQAGHRIYMLAGSPAQADTVDTRLWTFRDISFVPHARYKGDADPAEPVLIGHEPLQPQGADVLINLAETVPACYTQFERVIEIVDHDKPARARARERFRAYRDQGHDPETHELNQVT